jgi:hypothetical protein
VNAIIRRRLANYKRRIQRRLDRDNLRGSDKPMLTASNIHYELADKTRGLSCGGIGAMHLMVTRLKFAKALDRGLHLLKLHLPYHESDHVLTLAYLPLCGGTCIEDLERLRHDEVFLNALGARRIPDPTTAGDFCRRFTVADIDKLQDLIDETRLKVWAQQPSEFFDKARLEVDGHLVETTGECKEGMDIAYDGTWGYHPLLVSLANTREVLRIVNRSGNRPSHEGAAAEIDRYIALCLRAGFRLVEACGDTDFSQTQHLDRWASNPRVRFIFGFDARPNLQDKAENLPANAWRRLVRPPRYPVQTQTRQRPDKVKERIVKQREFERLHLQSEDVAEFDYQPTACTRAYRMVVVRKNISVEKGENRLYDEIRYFFYISNDRQRTPAEIVFAANDRCHQENLIEQLHNGTRALRAPVDNLESNWAYMVMTALAWNLKAWWALWLPEPPGRWRDQHRADKQRVLGMEFKGFVNAFVHMPCQIVRQAGKLIYRLLACNPQQSIFFRLVSALRS